jgi:carbohydrate kinase (thermoresistant glucokinase family)
MSQLFIVMGVSGCGKSTIGQTLADQLDCPFYDADDFHPAANVAKMASGTPLDDTDRAPWLAALAGLLTDHASRGETAVLACSALKKRYRDQLRVNDKVQFIFLDGSFDLIWQRMRARKNHYMGADMLKSQFDALERPFADEAINISIDQTVDEMLLQIQNQIK